MFTKDKVICADTGMLLIRLGLGLVFLVNGWQKLSGMEMTISFFSSLGLPVAVAYLVAIVEFLGGLAMILGVWTKWAGWAIAVIMAGAIYFVTGKMGFSGYQINLVALLTALGVAFAGPGAYTVHYLKGGHHEHHA